MAFSNLTLNTKVYEAQDIPGGTARWVEKSGGVGTSFSPLTLKVTPPAAGVRNYRVDSKLVIPVVSLTDSALGPAGTFLHQMVVNINVTTSNASTAAERTDAYLRSLGWFQATPFKDAVEDLTPVTW